MMDKLRKIMDLVHKFILSVYRVYVMFTGNNKRRTKAMLGPFFV